MPAKSRAVCADIFAKKSGCGRVRRYQNGERWTADQDHEEDCKAATLVNIETPWKFQWRPIFGGIGSTAVPCHSGPPAF